MISTVMIRIPIHIKQTRIESASGVDTPLCDMHRCIDNSEYFNTLSFVSQITLYASTSDQVQPHLFYKCNLFLCCKLGQLICCGTTFHSSPNYNDIKVSDSRHCTQELLNVPLPLQQLQRTWGKIA